MSTILQNKKYFLDEIDIYSLSDKAIIIQFFGTLSITTNQGTLTESEITSTLINRLLVYLLTFPNRKISQYELSNILWPDSDITSPIKQVKNVVYRARKILASIFLHNLIFSDRSGNYFINPDLNIIFDTSILDYYYNLGMQFNLPTTEKVFYLSKVLEIYKNDFLPSFIGDSWIDNQRTYYHLSYLQAVLTLLPLLYQERNHSDIYEISRIALLYEPENSDLLFWHIRSIYNLGGIDIAHKHFLQHINKLSNEQQQILNSIFNNR